MIVALDLPDLADSTKPPDIKLAERGGSIVVASLCEPNWILLSLIRQFVALLYKVHYRSV